MTPQAFLNAVLPDVGVYCFVGIANGVSHQLFPPSIDEMLETGELVRDRADSYFACSTYDSEGERNDRGLLRRTKSNALLVKSFWVDLDVGEDKKGRKYKNQTQAVQALVEFCEGLALPRPIIVNSGYGVHAYWVLKYAVEPTEWQPVADKLKAVLREKGIKFDPSRTGDIASIMRLPGTYNRKDADNPVDVSVMFGKYEAVECHEFAALLSVVDTPTTQTHTDLPFDKPDYVNGKDETTTNIAGELPPSEFKVIVASKKCAQITHIVENQDEIPEPLWRAGLSVAHACVDGPEAIHTMSNKHPEYNYAETQKKAELTVGPLSCEKFDEENPGVCQKCPMWGKITSPIQLGKVIPLAENKPEKVISKDAVTEDEREYEIPAYPYPYLKGEQGQVLIETTIDGVRTHDVVYDHPFYVVKRMQDPEFGEVLWMRLHMPKDGVREFSLPLADVGAKDRFRDGVSRQGVAVMGKKLDMLMSYVMLWTRELQKKEKTEMMRTQFGWTDEGTFIIGDREIYNGGVGYSPPAQATLNVCNMLTKKGTLEGWRRVVDFHATEGMENRAFAIFAGFGAPLMQFTQLNGGIINLTNKDSGSGKTSVQYIINSIWGEPRSLIINQDDTYNARMHRIGVLNSIPVTVDEITNMQAKAFSDFAYASTAGRAKNRMEGSSNMERINNTRWRTLVITSSNSSFEDKLRSLKAFPEGELMRLIEIPVERDHVHPKEYTDELFATIGDHYGIAGEIYMQYVVENVDRVKELLLENQRRIDADASLTQRERVWSAMAATIITGGMIAKELGLHNIDVERVAKWASSFLLSAKASHDEETATSSIGAIGMFLDSHQQNTLIINGRDNSGVPTAPVRDNFKELYIRVEPDTKMVFISANYLRSWCADKQVDMGGMLNDLKKQGVSVRRVTKRLGAGTIWMTAPTSVVQLHDATGAIISPGNAEGKPNLTVVKSAQG